MLLGSRSGEPGSQNFPSRHFGERALEQRCRFTADLRMIIWSADWGVALPLRQSGEPVVNTELCGAPGWQSATERESVLLRSGRDHHGVVAYAAVVGSTLACPYGPL